MQSNYKPIDGASFLLFLREFQSLRWQDEARSLLSHTDWISGSDSALPAIESHVASWAGNMFQLIISCQFKVFHCVVQTKCHYFFFFFLEWIIHHFPWKSNTQPEWTFTHTASQTDKYHMNMCLNIWIIHHFRLLKKTFDQTFREVQPPLSTSCLLQCPDV